MKTSNSNLFLNTPEDCQWLRDTHLKLSDAFALSFPFKSFALEGNEDCPSLIWLWKKRNPNYDDEPFMCFALQGDGIHYTRIEL